MNPKRLFVAGGKPVEAWQCVVCSLVWTDSRAAVLCCNDRCRKCGKEDSTRKGMEQCPECMAIAHLAFVQERFQKAEKVAYTGGYVWWEDGEEDSFHASLADFLTYCEEECVEPPGYVYLCQRREFVKIDLDSIWDQMGDEGYEDFGPEDLNGVEELEAAARAFEEKNKGVICYVPDYTKAVVIPPQAKQA